MKLVITYDREERDKIRQIQSYESLASMLAKRNNVEDIEAIISKSNESLGWENNKIVEVDDELKPVFDFLLGDNGYKRYKKITTLYNKLRDIADDIDSMRDDTFQMSEFLEQTIKEVKELVPPEDRD